jgi:hypothetical protein
MAYISDMLGELAEMADSCGRDRLSYAIRLAARHACSDDGDNPKAAEKGA